MQVYDIALRRIPGSSAPDQLWAIGLINNKLQVKKKILRNGLQFLPDWMDQYDFDFYVKAAAIQFDGSWANVQNTDNYVIETEHEPFYWYINQNNELYCQYGRNDSTRILIDTNVKTISVCKGYNSLSNKSDDQGIIAAYVKLNGTAWYQQYKYNSDNISKSWYGPFQLQSNETWNNVTVYRLNDYRMSFCLTNNIHNVWLYSERTYIGNAVAPERITLPYIIEEDLNFNYMPSGLDQTVRLISSEMSEDHLTIRIVLDKEIVFNERHIYSFTQILTFTGGISLQSCEATVENGQTQLILHLTEPPQQLKSSVTVNLVASPFIYMLLLDKYKVQCSNSVTTNFDITNYETYNILEPDTITLPEVVTIDFHYLGKVIKENHPKEDIILPEVVTLNLKYSEIFKSTYKVEEENIILPRIVNLGFKYLQTGSAPI